MLNKWLYKAKSSFLNFWADKTNRTTVVNIITQGGTITNEHIVPFGTYAFEIYATQETGAQANRMYYINMQGGQLKGNANRTNQKELHMKHIFPGQPYLERSDRFKIQNVSTQQIEFIIIYHRLMRANS